MTNLCQATSPVLTIKWNVTPRIRRGSNVSLFAAFYLSLLESNALSVCLVFFCLLALLTAEGGNNSIGGVFRVKIFCQKLWPALDKRVILDRRSTKGF